jgi:Arc/MetJ-type ribon-helix-helix transcriptional regulator
MRPKIEGKTHDLIQMFLDRGIYETQAKVIEAAVEALLEKRIEEESRSWDKDSDTPDDIINSQVG